MLSPLLQSSLESVFWIVLSSENIFSHWKYQQNPVAVQNGYLQFGNHRVQSNHLGPEPATGCRSRHYEDTLPVGMRSDCCTFSPGRFDCALCVLAGTSKSILGHSSHSKHFTQNVSQVSSFFTFKTEDFFLFHRHCKVRTVCQKLACLSSQHILPAINAFAPGYRVWTQALTPAPLWPHWETFFKLSTLPVPRTLPHHSGNDFWLFVCFICCSRVNYPGFCHCVSYQLPAPMGTAGWAWALVWALMQISSFLMFWSPSLGVKSLGIFSVS